MTGVAAILLVVGLLFEVLWGSMQSVSSAEMPRNWKRVGVIKDPACRSSP